MNFEDFESGYLELMLDIITFYNSSFVHSNIVIALMNFSFPYCFLCVKTIAIGLNRLICRGGA